MPVMATNLHAPRFLPKGFPQAGLAGLIIRHRTSTGGLLYMNRIQSSINPKTLNSLSRSNKIQDSRILEKSRMEFHGESNNVVGLQDE